MSVHDDLLARRDDYPVLSRSTYLASQINQAKDVLLGRGGPRRHGTSR